MRFKAVYTHLLFSKNLFNDIEIQIIWVIDNYGDPQPTHRVILLKPNRLAKAETFRAAAVLIEIHLHVWELRRAVM